MISYFSNELTAIRQISDLRFGIPIILGNNDTIEMIQRVYLHLHQTPHSWGFFI